MDLGRAWSSSGGFEDTAGISPGESWLSSASSGLDAIENEYEVKMV